MEPLLILEPVGVERVTTPDFSGEVCTLTVRIPISRKDDVDRNDTLRREVTALLAAAIAADTQG